jgi:hypothetical protein
MPIKSSPKLIYDTYSQKVSGIKNIIFHFENDRKNGSGYFVMENQKSAELLVKLEGEKILER